jgi:hypothetical protein
MQDRSKIAIDAILTYCIDTTQANKLLNVPCSGFSPGRAGEYAQAPDVLALASATAPGNQRPLAEGNIQQDD